MRQFSQEQIFQAGPKLARSGFRSSCCYSTATRRRCQAALAPTLRAVVAS